MKLNIVTIVLNGEPWIERHLAEFEKLTCDWTWHIREGQAANVNCTRWCKMLKPSLSGDGTHEYLKSISKHPRVKAFSQSWWSGGKVQMFNDMLKFIEEPCVLMEVDSDECWTAEQLETIVSLFSNRPEVDHMRFFCRYFVGPDIITTTPDAYGNNSGEWLRAWRFQPGMRFAKHEPPVLPGADQCGLDRDETWLKGLVFDHFAYATEAQLRYKEKFYGYKDAVAHWKRLQANTVWPVEDLRLFLPWVGVNVRAEKL